MIVLTDSMAPEIQSGDLILCHTEDAEDVKVGDIISFFDPAGNGTSVVTHRVVEITADEDGRFEGLVSSAQNTGSTATGSAARTTGKNVKDFNFKVSDDENVWTTDTSIELFQTSYSNKNGEVTVRSVDGKNVIAPGTTEHRKSGNGKFLTILRRLLLIILGLALGVILYFTNAQEFYFTSDLLDGKTHQVTALNDGTASVTLTLMNYADELRYSEVDIKYTVTVTDKDGNSVSEVTITPESGIIKGEKIENTEITVSGLQAGNTYMFTVTTNNTYKNELAFIIDTNLFLYEHQSTYTPNMPLRDLFYISSEYQKLVDHKSLYSSVLQKIPAPYFIVFYNGTRKAEDRWENALSEAYENLTGEPRLKLKVITLNINEGHNKELMEQCQTLREYAQYVGKVRKYTREMSLDTAVERAVDECIQEGILEEFLRMKRAEVIAMSIFEYDEEEEKKKLAIKLFQRGMPKEQIADMLEIEENLISQ